MKKGEDNLMLAYLKLILAEDEGEVTPKQFNATMKYLEKGARMNRAEDFKHNPEKDPGDYAVNFLSFAKQWLQERKDEFLLLSDAELLRNFRNRYIEWLKAQPKEINISAQFPSVFDPDEETEISLEDYAPDALQEHLRSKHDEAVPEIYGSRVEQTLAREGSPELIEIQKTVAEKVKQI